MFATPDRGREPRSWGRSRSSDRCRCAARHRPIARFPVLGERRRPGGPARSRAASSSSWRSPGRSCARRACSCSTSRRSGSRRVSSTASSSSSPTCDEAGVTILLVEQNVDLHAVDRRPRLRARHGRAAARRPAAELRASSGDRARVPRHRGRLMDIARPAARQRAQPGRRLRAPRARAGDRLRDHGPGQLRPRRAHDGRRLRDVVHRRGARAARSRRWSRSASISAWSPRCSWSASPSGPVVAPASSRCCSRPSRVSIILQVTFQNVISPRPRGVSCPAPMSQRFRLRRRYRGDPAAPRSCGRWSSLVLADAVPARGPRSASHARRGAGLLGRAPDGHPGERRHRHGLRDLRLPRRGRGVPLGRPARLRRSRHGLSRRSSRRSSLR